MCDEPGEGTDRPAPDNRYLMLVGGLLLLICVSLAVLWIGERRRRIRAERDARRYRQSMQTMAQFLPPGPPRAGQDGRKPSPPGPSTGPGAQTSPADGS